MCMWGWGQVCACVHVHVHVCARAWACERPFARISFRFVFVLSCVQCAHVMCVHELLHCISRWACEHVGRSACGHMGMWVCGQVGKSVRSRCFVQNFDRFVSFRFRVSKCACLRTAVCVSSLVAAACGHADMACEHMGMWACEPVGMCVCVNV